MARRSSSIPCVYVGEVISEALGITGRFPRRVTPRGPASIQNDSGPPQGLSWLCCNTLRGATPANFVGDLTMSERAVEVGHSWSSDIIGVVAGIGLYSVLFSLVAFLCLFVPA
jgi:hypothetical protein